MRRQRSQRKRRSQLWTLMRHARHLVVVNSVSGRTVDNSGRRQGNSGRLLDNGTIIRHKIGPVTRRGRRGTLLPAKCVPRGERHRQVR